MTRRSATCRTRTVLELMVIAASGSVAYLSLQVARHYGASPLTGSLAGLATGVFAHQILTRLNTRTRSRTRHHRH